MSNNKLTLDTLESWLELLSWHFESADKTNKKMQSTELSIACI